MAKRKFTEDDLGLMQFLKESVLRDKEPSNTSKAHPDAERLRIRSYMVGDLSSSSYSPRDRNFLKRAVKGSHSRATAKSSDIQKASKAAAGSRLNSPKLNEAKGASAKSFSMQMSKKAATGLNFYVSNFSEATGGSLFGTKMASKEVSCHSFNSPKLSHATGASAKPINMQMASEAAASFSFNSPKLSNATGASAKSFSMQMASEIAAGYSFNSPKLSEATGVCAKSFSMQMSSKAAAGSSFNSSNFSETTGVEQYKEGEISTCPPFVPKWQRPITDFFKKVSMNDLTETEKSHAETTPIAMAETVDTSTTNDNMNVEDFGATAVTSIISKMVNTTISAEAKERLRD